MYFAYNDSVIYAKFNRKMIWNWLTIGYFQGKFLSMHFSRFGPPQHAICETCSALNRFPNDVPLTNFRCGRCGSTRLRATNIGSAKMNTMIASALAGAGLGAIGGAGTAVIGGIIGLAAGYGSSAMSQDDKSNPKK